MRREGRRNLSSETASSPAACRRKQAEFTHAHNLAGWPCIATGASDRGEISPKSHSQNRAISLEKKSMGLPTGKRRRCRSRSRLSTVSAILHYGKQPVLEQHHTHTLRMWTPTQGPHNRFKHTFTNTHIQTHTTFLPHRKPNGFLSFQRSMTETAQSLQKWGYAYQNLGIMPKMIDGLHLVACIQAYT